MPFFENFPKPDDIAPEQVPPLDDKWVETVMAEIGAFLYKKQADLQARKIVRFVPSDRRDLGHSADQWKYYARHIADLVRQHGWTAYLIAKIDHSYSTLTISTPREDAAKAHKEALED